MLPVFNVYVKNLENNTTTINTNDRFSMKNYPDPVTDFDIKA